MEAYLEDNRPTIDEVCESYDECNKECPCYRFCHPQAESEVKKRMTQIDLEIPKCCNECKFVYDSCKCIITGS